MFASYHLPPQQFCRAPASSYQPTSQSPSFHQPRHTLHFSILSILLILSKTSTHSTQSTRLSKPPPSTRSTRLKICYLLFVYLVYFVVQFFASFAFFAAKTFYMFYTAKTSTRPTRFMANHLSITSQCPPLSGPTRRNIPSLFSFAIARATVLLSTPIISAISCVPTDGFARMAARIFCGVFCSVFCGVFCVLFREPFCALPPLLATAFGRQMTMRKPLGTSSRSGLLSPLALHASKRSVSPVPIVSMYLTWYMGSMRTLSQNSETAPAHRVQTATRQPSSGLPASRHRDCVDLSDAGASISKTKALKFGLRIGSASIIFLIAALSRSNSFWTLDMKIRFMLSDTHPSTCFYMFYTAEEVGVGD